MKRYSGKFVVRLPVTLHRSLCEEAFEQGISLNSLVVKKLEKHREIYPSGVKALFLKEKLPLKGVVLFGSYARGDAVNNSDKDLLFILSPGIRISRGLYKIWDDRLSEHFEPHVSPHFVALPVDPDQVGGLWLEIAIEGQVLYDQDGSVRDLLRFLRERIANGEYTRNFIHGHPYWLMKREVKIAK